MTAVGSQRGSVDVPVQVDVFGPTVLTIDGVVVSTGRPQVTRLIEGLVTERSAVVSTDVLIGHLWPEALPANPRKALNVSLSRLRQVLGVHADRLVAVGPGYRLEASVDIDRFEDLVEMGTAPDGVRGIEALRAALDLRRGSPFADDPDADLVALRRSAVLEAQWSAIARCAELLWEDGQNDAVIALTSSVDADTVQERIVIAGARALASSGRRSDALATTRQAIERLNSLGLDPSPALLRVEYDILTGAVDLAIRDVVPNTAPIADFVGRRRELTWMQEAGPGRAVAVIAEAGTGKSVLLSRFVALQQADGRRVVRVGVSATPRRPMDTAAQICLAVVASRELSDVDPEFRAALHRLCPEFGGECADTVSRDSVVVGIAGLIERHAHGSVLVIDDAHWLDGGSASVLERLVSSAALTVIMALRPTDQRALAFITDDAVTERCRSFELDPFNRDEVTQLMGGVTSRPVDDTLVAKLHDLSGGNALMLRLLIDGWVDGAQLDGPLPSSVLLAVTRRLDDLSRPARETLDVAACLGPTFGIDQLDDLRPGADGHLAEAENVGIVVVDRAQRRGSFRHALVADACRQLVAPGRAVSLHDDIGRSLELGAGSASELALHFTCAAALDPNRAIVACLRASAEFVEGFDWATALDYLDTAASVMSEHRVASDATNAQIAVRRGIIERALGNEEYVDHLLEGCDLARSVGADELFVVAVTELCGPGATSKAGTVDLRVRSLLDEALALETAPGIRAELCASSARLLGGSHERQLGRRLFREAWDIVQQLDDPDVESAVLMDAGAGFGHPDDLDLSLAASVRLTELAGSDQHLLWEAARFRFECAITLGDPVLAGTAIGDMRLNVPSVTGRPREVGMEFCESVHAMISGDLELAERHAEAVMALGLERFDPSWATMVHGMLMLGLRWETGRLAEHRPISDAAIERQPSYIPSRAVASLVALESGDSAAARQHLDVFMSQGVEGIEQNMTHTAMLVLAAPAVAEVGRTAEVEMLFGLLVPYSGRMSWNTPSARGPIDRALSVLAAAMGDHESADRYAAAADCLIASFRTARAENDEV